jgi:hypothetical protein
MGCDGGGSRRPCPTHRMTYKHGGPARLPSALSGSGARSTGVIAPEGPPAYVQAPVGEL